MADDWQPINTAPVDGTHILVINIHNPATPPTTVHWFVDGLGGCWHLSVNQMAAYSDYIWGPPTHWRRIPAWNHLL